MSRYIDADALGIGKAKREVFNDQAYADGWNSVIDIINAAPTVDAVPRDELIKLAKKVIDMREAQKRYFKGRSLNDLTESKQLEAEVDATVKAILDPDLTLF